MSHADKINSEKPNTVAKAVRAFYCKKYSYKGKALKQDYGYREAHHVQMPAIREFLRDTACNIYGLSEDEFRKISMQCPTGTEESYEFIQHADPDKLPLINFLTWLQTLDSVNTIGIVRSTRYSNQLAWAQKMQKMDKNTLAKGCDVLDDMINQCHEDIAMLKEFLGSDYLLKEFRTMIAQDDPKNFKIMKRNIKEEKKKGFIESGFSMEEANSAAKDFKLFDRDHLIEMQLDYSETIKTLKQMRDYYREVVMPLVDPKGHKV